MHKSTLWTVMSIADKKEVCDWNSQNLKCRFIKQLQHYDEYRNQDLVGYFLKQAFGAPKGDYICFQGCYLRKAYLVHPMSGIITIGSGVTRGAVYMMNWFYGDTADSTTGFILIHGGDAVGWKARNKLSTVRQSRKWPTFTPINIATHWRAVDRLGFSSLPQSSDAPLIVTLV